MTSKITSAQIASFIVAVEKHEVAGAKLMVTLSGFIETCGDVKAFRTTLYAAAKAKSDRAYAAIRQAFSRAVKSLGIETGEKRGINSKKAAAKPSGKTAAPAKDGGMSDALAIARVGQLATSFLQKDDQAIMSRLLAAIDNQRKLATKAK
jgi:hypothetical protein